MGSKRCHKPGVCAVCGLCESDCVRHNGLRAVKIDNGPNAAPTWEPRPSNDFRGPVNGRCERNPDGGRV